jgi:protein TonB
MNSSNNYSNPRASLITALILHLVLFLCAGFLAIPKKEKEPEHLFELVPPPTAAPALETEPIKEPPPPPPEPPAPEPLREPEPTPPPIPEPVIPEPELEPTPPPPPKPKPKPPEPRIIQKPKPPPAKKDPPQRLTPPKKILKKPPRLQTRKPQPRPPPRTVQRPRLPTVNVSLPAQRVRAPVSRTPVISPPTVPKAVKDNYLQSFYGILQRYWKRPPDGFLANKPVEIRFTVSHNGRLQAFSLIKRSGDAQLDNSILQALTTMRSRGVVVPPPGGRSGTYEITVNPG